jgi:hypothetical protein
MDVVAAKLLLLAATAGQKHLRSTTSLHLETSMNTELIDQAARLNPPQIGLQLLELYEEERV